ncbi:hypothetical protein [Salinibacter grassmerensis]|uniref:hypothetical protein n=1 Tax=Salinibacter grassmerensis TaxID=3040353 RepID=UPI0021E83239|nr:hypothetical protein [Salinibacter grassmerensis]
MIETEHTVTSKGVEWEVYRHPDISETFVFNRDGEYEGSEDVYFIARKIHYDPLTDERIVGDELQVVHARNCGVGRDTAELVQPVTSDLDKIVRLANGTDKDSIAHWIGDEFVELGELLQEFGREPTISFISSLMPGVWNEEDAKFILNEVPHSKKIGMEWDIESYEKYETVENPSPSHTVFYTVDDQFAEKLLRILDEFEYTKPSSALTLLGEDTTDHDKLKEYADIEIIEGDNRFSPTEFKLTSQ